MQVTPRLLPGRCLIGGEWRKGSRTLDVINPATGDALGTVPLLGAAETLQAIAAAQDALPAWVDLGTWERAAFLHRWRALIDAHRDDLATLVTLENGKPLAEARAEMEYAASFLPVAAEEMKRIADERLPSRSAQRPIEVVYRPVGVCAAITPWNFPAAMILRKVGSALAAGCTMVVKPAEETPLTALALGVLACEAGLPAGVLNLVTGDAPAIGETLTGSQTVRKLSFTGSTAVGELLYRACAPTMKRLTLELGGNAPLLVFADADVATTLEGLMIAKFRGGGQTCVAANRILVERSVYEAFVTTLATKIEALHCGDGMQDGIDVGPVITDEAAERIEGLIEDARGKGARILCGGTREGRFVAPTLIADVTPEMRAWNEEVFGPVAAVAPFEDEADALRLANDTDAGLVAYVFTNDPRRGARVAEALETGMVGINEGLISTAFAPFGGVKRSGIGREGGRWGVMEYLETRYFCERRSR